MCAEECNDIIRSARRRNPFTIVPVDQKMVVAYSTCFSPFFKKTVQAKKKALNIQRDMVLDYSSQHVTEVWVKYGSGEEGSGSKFQVEKRRIRIESLSTTQKYHSLLPLKQSKINNVHKPVDKYVPQEFHQFYSFIAGDEDISSETEESDED